MYTSCTPADPHTTAHINAHSSIMPYTSTPTQADESSLLLNNHAVAPKIRPIKVAAVGGSICVATVLGALVVSAKRGGFVSGSTSTLGQGTNGCENTCEKPGMTEALCTAVPFSACEWDAQDGRCWSNVGGSPCPTTQSEADELFSQHHDEHHDEHDDDHHDHHDVEGSHSYPGTNGCENTCEKPGMTEAQCTAVPFSACEWDAQDGRCWSNVGGSPCPTTQSEANELFSQHHDEHHDEHCEEQIAEANRLIAEATDEKTSMLSSAAAHITEIEGHLAVAHEQQDSGYGDFATRIAEMEKHKALVQSDTDAHATHIEEHITHMETFKAELTMHCDESGIMLAATTSSTPGSETGTPVHEFSA